MSLAGYNSSCDCALRCSGYFHDLMPVSSCFCLRVSGAPLSHPQHSCITCANAQVTGVPVRGNNTVVVRYAKLVTRRSSIHASRRGDSREITPVSHPCAYITAFEGELDTLYYSHEIKTPDEVRAWPRLCLHSSLGDTTRPFALGRIPLMTRIAVGLTRRCQCSSVCCGTDALCLSVMTEEETKSPSFCVC